MPSMFYLVKYLLIEMKNRIKAKQRKKQKNKTLFQISRDKIKLA